MVSTTTSRSDIAPEEGIKLSCVCGTTENITLSGLQTIDTIVLIEDDRVLVKDQTDASENGLYNASTGNWTRTSDFNANSDINNGVLVNTSRGATQVGIYRASFTGDINLGTTEISFVDDLSPGAIALRTDLASTASGKGAALSGYNEGAANSINRTVQARLEDVVYVTDKNAIGDGVTGASAAIINAIADAPAGGVIRFPNNGTHNNYILDAVVPITKPLIIDLNGCTLTASGNHDGFSLTAPNITSADKFLLIMNGKMVGDTKQGKGIVTNNNNPFVYIKNMQIRGWDKGVELTDSYCSRIVDSHIHVNNYGVDLFDACHASVLENVFCDQNVEVGLGVNRGGGTTRIHNVKTVGGAYQKSKIGIWAENCEDCDFDTPYHEGNTDIDIRLGFADAGAYARPAYNCTISTFQTASPCSTGTNNQNMVIEHAVGIKIYGADFKGGSSTATNNVYVDGFSDKVFLEYRGTSASTPFNFAGDAAKRVVLSQGGQCTYPDGMTALQFGVPGGILSKIYQSSVGGRNGLNVESLNDDLRIIAEELIRMRDSAGNDYVQVDFLNSKVSILKDLALSGTNIGFFSATPSAKPTITGSRADNAALADLLTSLAALGLITDSSSV